MGAHVVYRILRMLVDGRVQYLMATAGTRCVWTQNVTDSMTMRVATATRLLAEVKLIESALVDGPGVVEYAIQPFASLEAVPGPMEVSSPIVSPIVTVARRLVGPLGDALRLAEMNGKLDEFAELIRGGSPVSVDQIIATITQSSGE